MPLGYDGKLYILACDHRGSFQKNMFGIAGDPDAEQTETIANAKRIIFEGLEEAIARGADPGYTGILIDEQFGSDVPEEAVSAGLMLAMPVEKSGQNEFDFQYGDDFGAHIESFDPKFSKVLVRYNPEDPDTAMNHRQLIKLKQLSDWLLAHDRKFLFELLVPATEAQLASVDGDSDRYDAELRPQLMKGALIDIQDAGIEVDIWKIEGLDERADADMLAKQARTGPGREGVTCVLLGRGASDEKVGEWLEQAAPVTGFIGFAIGRSIWWDALQGFLDKSLTRKQAAELVTDKYLHFVSVYEASIKG